MSDANIDFKKISWRFYSEVVLIEDKAEPVDKMPSATQLQLNLLGFRGGFIRPGQMDRYAYAKLVPFWMYPSPFWPNNYRSVFEIGWGY